MSTTTFYKLVREGKLKTVKLFGRCLVTAEEEDEFRRKLAAGELATKPARPEWRTRPRQRRAARGAQAGEAA